MKTLKDILFIAFLLILLLPLVFSESAYNIFISLTSAHPYCMAFIKFAILATWGEMMVQRIRNGSYTYKGFGAVTKFIFWGLFGVLIAIGMKIFATGSPVMVESLGVEGVVEAMKGELTPKRVLGAFSISVMMNSIFAPFFMTLHKITDTHIAANNGSICSLVRPIAMKKIFMSLDWGVQWGFVFKKSIPLFWIPAHTITFLLPPTAQVLFAAILSVFLGIILSFATILSKSNKN